MCCSSIKRIGKNWYLINNTGNGKLIKLVYSTADDYREIMDTNVFSSFVFSKYAVEDMIKKKEGMIVFISSVTGHVGHEDETIYTMTKFAQRGLSQAINKDFGCKELKLVLYVLVQLKLILKLALEELKRELLKLIGKLLKMLLKGYCMLVLRKIKYGKLEWNKYNCFGILIIIL